MAGRERTAICEYAVKTGAGCDTAAQGTHAAAVHLRMWQFVKHGKDTCRIEMRLGTLCVGMVTASTRGASDLVFPWLHSGALRQTTVGHCCKGYAKLRNGCRGCGAERWRSRDACGTVADTLPEPVRVEQSYLLGSSACCTQTSVTWFV